MASRVAPVAVVLTMLAGPTAWADPPAAPPPSPIQAADSDAILAVKVTAALAADPALAGLSLTVDVMNRVAIVGGPVPDLDTLPRIRAALAKVSGLAMAKVSGWVAAPADPLARRVGEILRQPLTDPSVAPAAHHVPAPTPPAPLSGGLPPLVLAPSPDRGPPDPGRVPPLTRRPDARSPATVTALKPRTPAASTAPGPVDGWLLAPVPSAPSSAAPVAVSVSAARAADPRYAGLTADIKDGVVTVAGRVPRHADVWDFVAVVRKLPGVARVAVGRVTAGG